MKLTLAFFLLLSIGVKGQTKNWDAPYREPLLWLDARTDTADQMIASSYNKPGKSHHYSSLIIKKKGLVVLEIMDNGDVFIDSKYFKTKQGKARMKKVFNIKK